MAGNASDIEVHFNPNADETPVEVTLRRRSSENSSRKRSLCPKLFERASGSWWNPKFDSSIIEEQFQINSFSQIRRRFRYALCYILAACVVWLIYLPIRNTVADQPLDDCLEDLEEDSQSWIMFEVAVGCLLALCIILLVFTLTQHYQRHVLKVSILLGMCLCGLTLGTFASHSAGGGRNTMTMSSVATFAVCIETILMMYTMIPVPFLYTVIPMLIFSVAYELLYFVYVDKHATPGAVFTKLFLHMCVHLMGIHVYFMSQVRSRNTFMKIGQAVVARHQHQMEKQLKETTIHSLMPDVVFRELLKKSEKDKLDSNPIFRPFYMNLMKDVSILFADIAGFTRMSANKNASELVGLLNDLFGRFDILCLQHNCEKICTLGDCYYCVSGCPEKRDDHAECCVNMGLSMIDAIKDFCNDTGEKVNMRVGVHTGKVLCGIIGKRCYKFDVWSNAVTTANKMEASGIPGKVHVSAATAEFLGDKYIMEESRVDRQTVFLGGKTYFIVGRKEDLSSKSQQSDTENSTENQEESREEDSGQSDKGDAEGSRSSPQNGNQSSKPLLGETGSDSKQNSPVWGRNSPGAKKATTPEAMLHVPGVKGENGGLGPSRTPSVRDLIAEHSADGSPLPLNISLHNNPQRNSDQDFVDCIKQEGTTDYFHQPPINNLTLTFHNRDIEKLYRSQFRQDTSKEPRNLEAGRKNRRHSSETISTAKYNTVFDVAVSFVVYLLISVGCFLVFEVQVHWSIIFPIAAVLQLGILLAVLLQAFSKQRSGFMMVLSSFFHHWGPRHSLGAILISLPVLAVFANFLCQTKDENYQFTSSFFCFLIVVALLHFCNFVQLSSWMKTILACLCAIIMLVLFIYNPCSKSKMVAQVASNISDEFPTYAPNCPSPNQNYEFAMEAIIDVFLLLVLVLFLNREFEISYRLNFYGGVEAGQDKEQMQAEKEEAEDLLHQIIPVFVTEQMRSTSKFSQNHENVAVIFCSVVNFIDFYEEAYQGGKECIRVLHELISDFDNLLSLEQFESVEKIKTIGSTYMAACGLHPPKPEDEENKSLITMMDFAMEMISQVQVFNSEILNITSGAFEFIPRIGYNHGRLTSGVIGTTKLLYDIWGDTVNVASRMDSTGLAGSVQVAEHSKKALEPYYMFEYRGPVKVRGKGEMVTYLCKGKRDTPLLIEECNTHPASPNGPSPVSEA